MPLTCWDLSDELANRPGGSVDTATGAAIGPYRKSRLDTELVLFGGRRPGQVTGANGTTMRSGRTARWGGCPCFGARPESAVLLREENNRASCYLHASPRGDRPPYRREHRGREGQRPFPHRRRGGGTGGPAVRATFRAIMNPERGNRSPRTDTAPGVRVNQDAHDDPGGSLVR